MHAAVSSGPVLGCSGLVRFHEFLSHGRWIGQWVGRRRPAEFGSARLPPGSAARWRLAAGGRHGAGGEEARRKNGHGHGGGGEAVRDVRPEAALLRRLPGARRRRARRAHHRLRPVSVTLNSVPPCSALCIS